MLTLVWTSLLLGKLEVYNILDKVASDQTEFILFYTKSYVCENSLFYFCCCLDPDLDGAKHPDPVLEGVKHIHFSQFSCKKIILFAPSKAKPGFFGWYNNYYYYLFFS
jgi:hypothetical protein